MTRVVLDASVVAKWFRAPEEGAEEARFVRTVMEEGALEAVVPSLLFLEILNVAARRWGLDEERLGEVARDLAAVGFEVLDASLEGIVPWLGRGLTAYDASYVAIAESEEIRLVTDDASVLAAAPEHTIALTRVRSVI